MKSKKKHSIYRLFLIPMILIMIIQSGVTLGTLVFRKTVNMIQEYSINMMSRMVENRKVILENDINQRWSSDSCHFP